MGGWIVANFQAHVLSDAGSNCISKTFADLGFATCMWGSMAANIFQSYRVWGSTYFVWKLWIVLHVQCGPCQVRAFILITWQVIWIRSNQNINDSQGVQKLQSQNKQNTEFFPVSGLALSIRQRHYWVGVSDSLDSHGLSWSKKSLGAGRLALLHLMSYTEPGRPLEIQAWTWCCWWTKSRNRWYVECPIHNRDLTIPTGADSAWSTFQPQFQGSPPTGWAVQQPLSGHSLASWPTSAQAQHAWCLGKLDLSPALRRRV